MLQLYLYKQHKRLSHGYRRRRHLTVPVQCSLSEYLEKSTKQLFLSFCVCAAETHLEPMWLSPSAAFQICLRISPMLSECIERKTFGCLNCCVRLLLPQLSNGDSQRTLVCLFAEFTQTAEGRNTDWLEVSWVALSFIPLQFGQLHVFRIVMQTAIRLTSLAPNRTSPPQPRAQPQTRLQHERPNLSL